MKVQGNILVLTQWSFKDALVQTYTLPYVEIIRKILPAEKKIIVVTAEQPQIALSADETDQINRDWQKKNMQLLPEVYKRLGFKKILGAAGNIYKLYRVIKKEKIKTIHAFCTPAGSIGYLLSKFTGTKLIIDSYEPHAEAMVENGTWKKKGIAYKILFSFEKKQTKYATALIATTAGMKQYARDKYGVEVKNLFIKPACVDLERFFPRDKDSVLIKELHLENKVVCVYAGKLGGIYYKEEVFDFIKACHEHWKDDFRCLLFTNAAKREIGSEIKRVNLPDNIVISRFVFHKEIPKHLSLGDFAINPVKPVLTKRFCTSIKDGEYWAMGLPVIISPNISDDSAIIAENKIGVVVDFENKGNLHEAVFAIDELMKSKRAQELKTRIRKIAEAERGFSIAEKVYYMLYNQ